MFEADHHHRQVVLQVILANPTLREQVERCLRNAGFAVLGPGGIRPGMELGTVTSVIEITRREAEVLSALTRFDGSKEIAAALGVTEKVVDDHVQRLMGKLDVHSRHRLLLKALQLGLLTSTVGT